MLVGSLAVGLYIVASGEPLVWELSGLWLLVLNGVATVVATFMLFEALTRGPVSLGSPIVSSYPAFAVPMTVAFGARPEPIHWVAMAATLGGVWLVALAVSRVDAGDRPEYSPAVLRRAVPMALGAAIIFAIAILAADEAVDRYGLPLTLLSGRVIGAIVLGVGLLVMRRSPRMPVRVWPLVLLLATVDTLGYVFVYAGLALENGEFAIVTSSAYSVVTILLARIFLRGAGGAASVAPASIQPHIVIAGKSPIPGPHGEGERAAPPGFPLRLSEGGGRCSGLIGSISR